MLNDWDGEQAKGIFGAARESGLQCLCLCSGYEVHVLVYTVCDGKDVTVNFCQNTRENQAWSTKDDDRWAREVPGKGAAS